MKKHCIFIRNIFFIIRKWGMMGVGFLDVGSVWLVIIGLL